MNRFRLPAICACVAALAAASAIGEDLSIKPRAGVLLLHNGELIAGNIIAAGDRYDIQLPTGEISIKRSQVALVCRDAEDCYRRQQASIATGGAREHLALAEWCIKNQLLEPAETELAAARAADSTHPKIRLVEARLALARQPLPSHPPEPKHAAPESLDAVARNLPPGTMEQFTSTIQPMLLNYCAKSGCHAGRGQGGWQLERMHPKLAGRFSTQRNLRRVLAQVDLANPKASKLLQVPIRAHGPAAAPIFTDREQTKYRQLVEWVYEMAGIRQPQPEAEAEPTLADRTAPLLQAVPGASRPPATEVPAPHVDPAVVPAAAELPEPQVPDGRKIPASSADQAFTREQLRELGLLDHATSRVQHDPKQPAPFAPRDPFDPEIFNRRYFGE